MALHLLACATGPGSGRYLDVHCIQAGRQAILVVCAGLHSLNVLWHTSQHASLSAGSSICALQ